MKSKRFVLLLAGLLAVTLVAASCGPKEQASTKYKVAMIMTGPISDAGWNASAHRGLMEAKDKFGVEVAFTEMVQAPDYETVMRDYATKGYNLIIAHGFQLTDATLRVGASFPKVQFSIVNGTKVQAPNVSAFRNDSAQTGFIGGAVAGLLTKTNKVGIMVATKSANYQASMNGFQAGAKYVNPAVTVISAYTDTSEDISKGKEVARAMAEQGADFVACNANQVGLGSIDGAKQAGIKAVGFISDQNKVAPETVVASAMQRVDKIIVSVIEKGQKNELKPEITWVGVKEGVIGLSPFHNHDASVPQAVKDKLAEVLRDLANGSLRQRGILPTPLY